MIPPVPEAKNLMSYMEETLVIPIDDISQIVVFYYKKYALEGFLVGIAMDVLVIYVLSKSFPSNMSMNLE